MEENVNKLVNNIIQGNNIFGVGKIIQINDFIIKVTGLDDVMFYEKVIIGENSVGYVINIEKNYVYVALLKLENSISLGDAVYQTNEVFSGTFSMEAIGRVTNIFGYDELNNQKFAQTFAVEIESDNIPIMDRTSVKRPLHTGIVGIDLIYPIGKGQRQLIIGDKKTGKTELCKDIILNQKNQNMLCIYVAIGKTKKEVKELYQELVQKNSMAYSIIITAFNDDLPSVLALTPYYALSVATMFMLKGYDVLVILDDLKRHADAYREISLISGKTPSRDAYPSDIFYFHSRLLEKGCQYKNKASLTILPIVETKANDITDYISTNIISITDGQIVLSSKNFQKGIKPAIDYGLSVSRLGGNVQTEQMKKLGASVRSQLLSYLETQEIYEIANIDQMSVELQNKIFNGKKIMENLIQFKGTNLTDEEMIARFQNLGEENNV